MDAFQFDYTAYSDASTPRTPSPRTSLASDGLYSSPTSYKSHLDLAVAVPRIFDHHPEEGILSDAHAIDPAATTTTTNMWSSPNQYHAYPHPPSSRASLLDELYDQDLQDNHLNNHDAYSHPTAWSAVSPQDHQVSQPMRHIHDIAMQRRATFPYVRHDKPDSHPYPSHPFMPHDQDSLAGSPYNSRPSTVYGEHVSLDASPHFAHHMDEPFAHTVPISPHSIYDHIDGIKTEDAAPVIVPSQTAYCRPPSAGMHPLPCLPPHAGLIVQHTDDAASKETQYLRRRCFNCHTTEPPSWRRSTLNPGKIVCNKCGLYERTHLRPRPLRFDELRAGSKTRKQPKVGGSPKVGKIAHVVKKEPRDESSEPLQRRSSVSSSSASSGSGNSDWDDNVSTYSSSGSAPPSSFNSPAVSAFSIPRDPNSSSPQLMPRDGGIRLPNAPLSDIASLQSQHPSPPPSISSLSSPLPRKSATLPASFYPADMYSRRGSTGSHHPVSSQPPHPEVTGWQGVPLPDLTPKDTATAAAVAAAAVNKARSNSLQKPVAA